MIETGLGYTKSIDEADTSSGIVTYPVAFLEEPRVLANTVPAEGTNVLMNVTLSDILLNSFIFHIRVCRDGGTVRSPVNSWPIYWIAIGRWK